MRIFFRLSSAAQKFCAARSQATSFLRGCHSSFSICPPDPVLGGNFSGKTSVQVPHHLVTCPARLVSCGAEQGSGPLGSMIGRAPRAQNSLPPTPGPGEGEEGVETHRSTPPSWPRSWGRSEETAPSAEAKGTACTEGEGWCQEGL